MCKHINSQLILEGNTTNGGRQKQKDRLDDEDIKTRAAEVKHAPMLVKSLV